MKNWFKNQFFILLLAVQWPSINHLCWNLHLTTVSIAHWQKVANFAFCCLLYNGQALTILCWLSVKRILWRRRGVHANTRIVSPIWVWLKSFSSQTVMMRRRALAVSQTSALPAEHSATLFRCASHKCTSTSSEYWCSTSRACRHSAYFGSFVWTKAIANDPIMLP